MLLELLKEIENTVEGDEYISYGASYFIKVDRLDCQITHRDSLRKLFLDLEVDIEDTSVEPIDIKDRLTDFNMINDLWHFHDDIADRFRKIITDADAYYSPLDKDDYYSSGNVNDIFRILKKGDELVIIEFYACD